VLFIALDLRKSGHSTGSEPAEKTRREGEGTLISQLTVISSATSESTTRILKGTGKLSWIGKRGKVNRAGINNTVVIQF
jgi:hypothetical protein